MFLGGVFEQVRSCSESGHLSGHYKKGLYPIDYLSHMHEIDCCVVFGSALRIYVEKLCSSSDIYLDAIFPIHRSTHDVLLTTM